MSRECEICGDDHDATMHGDAIVLLQPSLHTVEEFNVEAIEEMYSLESDNPAIAKLYKEFQELHHDDDDDDCFSVGDAINEICDEMMSSMRHPIFFGEDTFAIYEK